MMLSVKCTSPSCSKITPQHDAASSVLHIWDDVIMLKRFSLSEFEWDVSVALGVMASCLYRTSFTVDNDSLPSFSSIFTRSLALVLWFINIFHTRTCSVLGH
ncbi:hypothetical protein ILYODFUR_028943 [Ilyodon furcidens]|uniref:Uncharacterized protein n=1 Tax=Ilyodon furcidens TaxID=33524 RepID=A0ABV0U9E9_9TELE